jgi:hypothetical protein
MRARIVNMDKNIRQSLGLFLWQIFEVENIKIVQHGRKYPRETKWINCLRGNWRPIRFLWYEVEILE